MCGFHGMVLIYAETKSPIRSSMIHAYPVRTPTHYL